MREKGKDGGPGLARRLGTTDAVVVGLGAMLGAGVFAVFAPATAAAGGWVLVALLVAAAVAYCNASSSGRLAAIYPESGGTYVYGRRRLGEFWGFLAGWGFVVGKSASCAAMALTFGAYVAPDLARPLAVAAVVGLTVLNLFGVHRSALAARIIVAVVLAVLAGFVVASLAGGTGGLPRELARDGVGLGGVLQAAGLLFFAFAGYARIASMGEEVRDPARTIPRAIPIALGIALVVYLAVAAGALSALGEERLAGATAPLAEAATAAGAPWLAPVVRGAAAVAALGALLALVLGVSRTVLAMARGGHFPRALAAVHSARQVPHRAEIIVGVVVALLVMVADLREAIGFSSFAVLVYYAIANAAAWTLPGKRRSRFVPSAGLVGCVVLAVTLPASSVGGGLAVFALGALIFVVAVRRSRRETGVTG